MNADSIDADLQVAREYADAYAAFDEERLEQVLAGALTFRQVNPSGYLTFDSAKGYLDATRDFLSGFQSFEPVCCRAEWVGDRIATTARVRLFSRSRTWLMEQQEYVTLAGGQIVAIDSVCSGARPCAD